MQRSLWTANEPHCKQGRRAPERKQLSDSHPQVHKTAVRLREPSTGGEHAGTDLAQAHNPPGVLRRHRQALAEHEVGHKRRQLLIRGQHIPDLHTPRKKRACQALASGSQNKCLDGRLPKTIHASREKQSRHALLVPRKERRKPSCTIASMETEVT